MAPDTTRNLKSVQNPKPGTLALSTLALWELEKSFSSVQHFRTAATGINVLASLTVLGKVPAESHKSETQLRNTGTIWTYPVVTRKVLLPSHGLRTIATGITHTCLSVLGEDPFHALQLQDCGYQCCRP